VPARLRYEKNPLLGQIRPIGEELLFLGRATP
jgi:hypothetical protein